MRISKQPEQVERALRRAVRQRGRAMKAEVRAFGRKRARVVAQAGVRVPSRATSHDTAQRGETRLGTGTRTAALHGAPRRAQQEGVR